MGSTDTFTTGAAGAAPSPAAVVRPSRCDRLVGIASTAAPLQGTGLTWTRAAGGMEPAVSVVRPWDLPLFGTGVAAGTNGTAVLERTTVSTGVPAVLGGYAHRIASTTPGALPPRDPLS